MMAKGPVSNEARVSGVFPATDKACDVFRGWLP